MKWLIKLAEFFGLFNKLRSGLQGKKTYLINAIGIVSALGVLLAAGADALQVLAQMLGFVVQFADGAITASKMHELIVNAAQAHAGLLATFGAGWAGLLHACQNISRYAHQARATDAIFKAATAPIAHLDVVPVTQPNPNGGTKIA